MPLHHSQQYDEHFLHHPTQEFRGNEQRYSRPVPCLLAELMVKCSQTLLTNLLNLRV